MSSHCIPSNDPIRKEENKETRKSEFPLMVSWYQSQPEEDPSHNFMSHISKSFKEDKATNQDMQTSHLGDLVSLRVIKNNK